MDKRDLEDYVRTAQVTNVCALPLGTGHQHKQLMILDGGMGVVAKLAEAPDVVQRPVAMNQVRGEIAAWWMACELGWDDLVPVTTLGAVVSRFTGDLVAASLQVVWPRFEMAAEVTLRPGDCEPLDEWRVAIFDTLAGNTDRNNTNWGRVKESTAPRLIDNGNGFGAANTNSEFATDRRNANIPDECLVNIDSFVEQEKSSELWKLLERDIVQAIFGRALAMSQSRSLTF